MIEQYLVQGSLPCVLTKPLVKWAGGKRQILPHLLKLVPENFDTYFEPFAGGLALFASLSDLRPAFKSVLTDLNRDLIELYIAVRDRPLELAETILAADFRNDRDFFYRIREEYNRGNGSSSDPIRRASELLYLNRHCFNGLFRVNSKNDFNVPFGKYKNPRLPDRKEIMEFSSHLQDSILETCDFSKSLKRVREGDFVYLDPPYFPVSNTSRFTEYTGNGFTITDQKRLLRSCLELDRKGVKFVLSNSASDEFNDLAHGFKVMQVPARRNINSHPLRRSGHFEAIVTNQDIW